MAVRFSEVLSQMLQPVAPEQHARFRQLSEKVGKLDLSYAEVILLTEGSRSGMADCTLPPYVQYESDWAGADNSIRSEVLEWFLDSTVSTILLQSGSLNVIGARILASLDFNVPEEKQAAAKTKPDVRFALDLGSRTLRVDLRFEYCHFNKGINLSNSYLENFILVKCVIGKTEVQYQNSSSSWCGFSIYAMNTSFNGEFQLLKKPDRLGSSSIDPDKYNIEGGILLEQTTSSGSVKCEDLEIRGIVGMQHTHISHVVSFSNSEIHGMIKEVESIEGLNECAFNGWGLHCGILFMDELIAHKPVRLTFATIEGLFSLSNSRLFGYGYSFQAGGLKAKAVFLRNTFALHGAALQKSDIETDLDCSGSFFGYSFDDYDDAGPGLIFRKSKARNVYFTDGFIATGVDVSSAVLNNLYAYRGMFMDYKIRETDNRILPFYAINTSNCIIHQKLSFNPDAPRRSSYRLTIGSFAHHWEFRNNILKKRFRDFDEDKYREFEAHYEALDKDINLQLEKIKEKKEYEQLKAEINKEWRNRLKQILSQILVSLADVNLEKGIILYRTFNPYFIVYETLQNMSGFCNGLAVKKEAFVIHDYSLVYGEAMFQEIRVQGDMDCAGAVFYREGVQDEISVQTDIWKDSWCWLRGKPSYEKKLPERANPESRACGRYTLPELW